VILEESAGIDFHYAKVVRRNIEVLHPFRVHVLIFQCPQKLCATNSCVCL